MRKKGLWIALGLVAVLALSLVVVSSLIPNDPFGIAVLFQASRTQPVHALANPTLPKRTKFNDRRRAEHVPMALLDGIADFSFKVASQVLPGDQPHQNAVFSPISLYMAFSLAAEGAAGETQTEMLSAVDLQGVQNIAEYTGKLFRNLYMDNEMGKLMMASSLWLQRDISLRKSFLDRAAKQYYASVFAVDFQAPGTPKRMAQWVSENTNAKLGGDPSAFRAEDEQIMALINILYFKDEWVDRFDKAKTKPDSFTCSDGTVVTCDFMNMRSSGYSFAKGEGYTASEQRFKGGQSMVFILPDEGVSVGALMGDPARLQQAVNSLKSDLCKKGDVVFKIPKFNFTSSMDLVEPLKKLGVEKAFSMWQADFSNLTDRTPIYIQKIQQTVTLSINEKGCEAAAFTEINYCGAARPTDRVDMILDRPFIFAIVGGAGDAPLFVGVVNDPTK